MRTSSFRVLGALLIATGYCFAQTPKPPPTSKQTTPVAQRQPIFAPIHPLTGEDENVFGNPEEAGKPFVVRVRELPGTIAAPHTHTFDENITVLQGTWYFGIGDQFDPAKLHELPAGSFVFIPSGTPMFGYAPKAVTVQVHGIGPFTQKFCHPLVTLVAISEDKTIVVTPSAFRFHDGDRVTSAQGSGRIRQGYATGNVVEYEVVAADGSVFMVQERDIHR